MCNSNLLTIGNVLNPTRAIPGVGDLAKKIDPVPTWIEKKMTPAQTAAPAATAPVKPDASATQKNQVTTALASPTDYTMQDSATQLTKMTALGGA